ncbi:uncharacterized protein LOC114289868 isoform X3 [Camellia sinensis]|nr:uncharacterized protein LOC114289868 isoform X3 [Camellia sinensis]
MSLTTINSLQVLDLSNNHLTGVVPVNGSFQLFTSSSFRNNNLIISPTLLPPPFSLPLPSIASVPLEPLLEELLLVLPCCFSHLLGRPCPKVRQLRRSPRVPNFEQNLGPPTIGVYHIMLFHNYFNISSIHLFSCYRMVLF